jgi:membrane protein YqaA with SNARE-associated domain
LLFLSIAEASFFPVPPEVLLAPMVLGGPKRAWRYAFWATIGSVIGGLLGYLVGAAAIHTIKPLLLHWGYHQAYQQVMSWFYQWGFYTMLIASFTPLPYKLFTIAAGALKLPLLPFVAAAFIGRGARYYLIVSLIKRHGPRIDDWLLRYIDVAGWALLGLILIGWFLYKMV